MESRSSCAVSSHQQLVPIPPSSARREECAALLVRFAPRLRGAIRLALSRTGSPVSREDVDDLVQESFCRLLTDDRWTACRGGEAALVKFFVRLGVRVALDRVRLAQAQKRGRYRLVSMDDLGLGFVADRTVDPTPGPEERLLRVERDRDVVGRCEILIGGRSPKRDLGILRLALAGWCSAEISRACGLTPRTVDTLLFRVKRRLARSGGVGLLGRSRGPRQPQL